MRNIKLTISYDGTSFSGWQRQQNAPTIQGAIEEKLALMTGEKICIHGAGRTDAGVHARAMTAHFASTTTIPCHGLLKGLNSLLPDAVRIMSVEEVSASFHARLSARAKVYRYFFSTAAVVPATRRLYCAHYPGYLALTEVRECLEVIKGVHDFTSFEASGSRDRDRVGGRGAVREIYSVSLTPVDSQQEGEYLFEICGDGFLRRMVRNIVGTLIEVGQNRLTVTGFADLLQKKDRSLAGPTAPACGLVLLKVYYGENWSADECLSLR